MWKKVKQHYRDHGLGLVDQRSKELLRADVNKSYETWDATKKKQRKIHKAEIPQQTTAGHHRSNSKSNTEIPMQRE
jgi:hypothetical protein